MALLPKNLGVTARLDYSTIWMDDPRFVIHHYTPVYVVLGEYGAMHVPKSEADRLGLPFA